MVSREPVAFEIPARLARWEPSDAPVVSCYVDWSVSGRGLHEQPTVVRHALREALGQLEPRSTAYTSLEADVERIETFLAKEADPAARALAIFACSAAGLWEVHSLGVPLATRVQVGERPLLLPLVEATQDAARTLVAVVDTNSARLISLAPSGASEVAGPSRETATVKHSTEGGWGSLGYQRHVDTEIERFAADIASVIEDVMKRQDLHHLVLAGGEAIVPPIAQALSEVTRSRLDAREHIDIREGRDSIAERVWPEVASMVHARRLAEVGVIVGRVEAGRDAVGTSIPVLEAVRAGRVDTLALDADRVEEAAAELLLHEALAHRSRVLVVRGESALTTLDGLAATLR